jgi:hypothetical protein
MLWRFAMAHVLEREHDRVVIVHVRTDGPTGWVPIVAAQTMAGDAVRAVSVRETPKGMPPLDSSDSMNLHRRRAGFRRRCVSALRTSSTQSSGS